MTEHPLYVEPTIGISTAEATLHREIHEAERAQRVSDAIEAEAQKLKMEATAALLAAKEAAAANLQHQEEVLARARSAAEAQDRHYETSADIARAQATHRRQLLDIRDGTVGLRATAPILHIGDTAASPTTVPPANASQALAQAAQAAAQAAGCQTAAAPIVMPPSAIVYTPTNRMLSSLASILGCTNGLPPMRRRRK